MADSSPPPSPHPHASSDHPVSASAAATPSSQTLRHRQPHSVDQPSSAPPASAYPPVSDPPATAHHVHHYPQPYQHHQPSAAGSAAAGSAGAGSSAATSMGSEAAAAQRYPQPANRQYDQQHQQSQQQQQRQIPPQQPHPPPPPPPAAAPQPQPPPPPPAQSQQQQQQQQQQASMRERAVAGAMGLGIMTAAVGGTYLLSDNDAVFPIAVVACVATVSSVLVRYALVTIHGAANRPRVRHLRHHRHFTGERAEYVRHSQRLAMMDRDFTDADYEMLLDLDNNSQCFRRFLEGASSETINRLPTYVYKSPSSSASRDGDAAATRSSAEATDACERTCAGGNEREKEDAVGVDEEEDEIAAVKAANQSAAAASMRESELSDDTAHKCVICLEDYTDGTLIRILPCFHRFTASCIDPWLMQQAKCPVCKREIREDLAAMPPGFT